MPIVISGDGLISGITDLDDGSVEAADLGSSSVTTAKLADDAVTNAKVADGAIDTAHFSSTAFDGISQHMIPNGNEVYDLGEPENKWRDLYLSSATIHLGADTKLSVASDGNLEVKDANDTIKSIRTKALELDDPDGDDTYKTVIKKVGGSMKFVKVHRTTNVEVEDNSVGSISNISEDTTPQLGGNLDGQSYNITTTGNVTATSFVGDGSGLTGIGGSSNTVKSFTVETGKSVTAQTIPNFYAGKIGFNPVANTFVSTSTTVTSNPARSDDAFEGVDYLGFTPDNKYVLLNRSGLVDNTNITNLGSDGCLNYSRDNYMQTLDPSNGLSTSTAWKTVNNQSYNVPNGWSSHLIQWVGTNANRRYVHGGGASEYVNSDIPNGGCGFSVGCTDWSNYYWRAGLRAHSYLADMNSTYTGHTVLGEHSVSATSTSYAYAAFGTSWSTGSGISVDMKFSAYHDDMAIRNYKILCSSVQYDQYFTSSLTGSNFNRTGSNSTVFGNWGSFRYNEVMGRPHNSKAKGFRDITSRSIDVFDFSAANGVSNQTTYTCSDMVADGVNGTWWCRPDRNRDILIAFSRTSNLENYWYTVEIDYTNQRLNMLNKYKSKIYYSGTGNGTYRNYIPDNKFAANPYIAANTDTSDAVVVTYYEYSKPQMLTAEIDPTTLYVTGEGAVEQLWTTAAVASPRFRENGTDSQTFDLYHVYGGDLYHKIYTIDNASTSTIQLVGVSKSAGSSGDSVDIITSGVADGFTGLTANTDYYYDNTAQDGSITTDSVGNTFIGHAISDTEILLTDLSST